MLLQPPDTSNRLPPVRIRDLIVICFMMSSTMVSIEPELGKLTLSLQPLSSKLCLTQLEAIFIRRLAGFYRK